MDGPPPPALRALAPLHLSRSRAPNSSSPRSPEQRDVSLRPRPQGELEFSSGLHVSSPLKLETQRPEPAHLVPRETRGPRARGAPEATRVRASPCAVPPGLTLETVEAGVRSALQPRARAEFPRRQPLKVAHHPGENQGRASAHDWNK